MCIVGGQYSNGVILTDFRWVHRPLWVIIQGRRATVARLMAHIIRPIPDEQRKAK